MFALTFRFHAPWLKKNSMQTPWWHLGDSSLNVFFWLSILREMSVSFLTSNLTINRRVKKLIASPLARRQTWWICSMTEQSICGLRGECNFTARENDLRLQRDVKTNIKGSCWLKSQCQALPFTSLIWTNFIHGLSFSREPLLRCKTFPPQTHSVSFLCNSCKKKAKNKFPLPPPWHSTLSTHALTHVQCLLIHQHTRLWLTFPLGLEFSDFSEAERKVSWQRIEMRRKQSFVRG